MDKIIKARVELICEYPFFGRLATLFKLQENEDIPTAGTDGETLYFNPKFINKLTSSEIMFVLAHEVMHCALGHLWRKEEREPMRWNVACDYAINLILQQNNFDLCDGALIDSKYLHDNAETIYEQLPKTKTFTIQIKGSSGDQSQQSDKDSKEGQTAGHKMWQKSKSQDGKTDKSKQSKWSQIAKNNMKPKTQKMWEGALSEALKASKDRGETPAGLERLAEEIDSHEDWKQILSDYLSASMTDFDFMKRDRRTMSYPFYLPDLESTEDLENIVVAVDTSGSIGQQEINSFLGEIRAILKFFPKVKGWLIDCDAQVNQCIELDQAQPGMKFYGGGGTSHVPVFEEIKRRDLNPKVVLCFTDLYTDFPSKHPNYPVLWLATPDHSSETVPFGRVIELKDWSDL